MPTLSDQVDTIRECQANLREDLAELHAEVKMIMKLIWVVAGIGATVIGGIILTLIQHNM